MAQKRSKKVAKSKRTAVPVKAAKEAPKKGPGKWWETAAQFLREVKTELKKVTWPSRKQTVSSTGVVVVLVLVVASFLALVDAILSRLVRYVIG
jgi:preprotein translocase subunit SecE